MAGLSFKLKESVFLNIESWRCRESSYWFKMNRWFDLKSRLFRVLQTIDPNSTREATRQKSRDLVNIGRTKKI